VTLDENGLPARVQSYFSPTVTHLVLQPRDILNGGAAFTVKTAGEKTGTAPLRFTREDNGLFCWEHSSRIGDVMVTGQARMAYDGYLEYEYTLDAAEDTALDDVTLRLPFKEDAAKYMMGMGVQYAVKRGTRPGWGKGSRK
jgi:hypothetical protein